MKRRNFLTGVASATLALAAGGFKTVAAAVAEHLPKKRYGMGIQIEKCIGCGRCMVACKAENKVPKEPFFFRTWVERYIIRRGGKVTVECIDADNGHQVNKPILPGDPREILHAFYVPKLCNHCENAPCVQVCPVEATYATEEGVVIVDKDRCVGCRYCIQACPYGARFMNPTTMTADKCTFCYHRITKGLLPACVEVCPTQARVFGDLNSPASPLERLKRTASVNVLKPSLNTQPKVFYTNLDGEVR